MMKIPDPLTLKLPQVRAELARKLGLDSSSLTERPQPIDKPVFLPSVQAIPFAPIDDTKPDNSPWITITDDPPWIVIPPARVLFSFDSDSPNSNFALIEVPGNPPRYAFLVNDMGLSPVLGEICKELGKTDLPVLEPDEHHRMLDIAAKLENYHEPVDEVIATLKARIEELESRDRNLQIRELRYLTIITVLSRIKKEAENLLKKWREFEVLRDQCIGILESENDRKLRSPIRGKKLDTEIPTVSDVFVLFHNDNTSEESIKLKNSFSKGYLKRILFDPYFDSRANLEELIELFISENFEEEVVKPITTFKIHNIAEVKELQSRDKAIYYHYPINTIKINSINTYALLRVRLTMHLREIKASMEFFDEARTKLICSHRQEADYTQKILVNEINLFEEAPGQEGHLAMISDLMLGENCMIDVSDHSPKLTSLRKQLNIDNLDPFLSFLIRI